jgi:type IV pilus biogenesis protein CpaD/CtpE
VPTECPAWSYNDINLLDNKPLPQFGCATARNLALMVDRPQDLLEGRPSGNASGVLAAGSILRYNNNQTRGLVYIAPQSDNSVDATTAPSATSALSGETPPASPAAAGK